MFEFHTIINFVGFNFFPLVKRLFASRVRGNFTMHFSQIEVMESQEWSENNFRNTHFYQKWEGFQKLFSRKCEAVLDLPYPLSVPSLRKMLLTCEANPDGTNHLAATGVAPNNISNFR